MIKLTFCLTRLPHLTLEAFLDYWRGTHAPLVASVREPLRILRYVQSHSLPPETSEGIRRSRGAPAGFDGVAELWWDSFDDMQMSARDPDAVRAGRILLEDECRFIDLSRSPMWWSHEHHVF
jgi:hypothetical protein